MRQSRLPLIGWTVSCYIPLVRHPVGVINCKLGVDHRPILPPACPLFRDVQHGQIQHFEQAVIGGKNGLGFGHFSQLAVEALDGVCSVNQPPEFFRKLEKGTQIGPVFSPGSRNLGVFLVPFFGEAVQRFFCRGFIHRRVHLLQIRHERFQIFVRNVLAGIPQMVNDAILYIRFGKYRLNGVGESGQVVCAGDENILHAPVPQAVEYRCPVFGTFVLANPHPQHVFFAVQVDSYGDVYRLFHDLALTADVVMDGVHEHHRINAFQRPLLPFLRCRKYLVRDPAHGAFRRLDAVDVPDVIHDVRGGHPLGVHGDDFLLHILADAGLILFQNHRLKLSFPISRHLDKRVTKTGPQRFAAVAVSAIVRFFLLRVVPIVSQMLVHFRVQPVFHEFRDGLTEQQLDVLHPTYAWQF